MFRFLDPVANQMNDTSQHDWHTGKDSPSENTKVAFELIHDPVHRVGRFRNFLYIESGDTPKLWASRTISRWVYLDDNGEMMRKPAQA
jgi:hypothetical protein